MFKKVVCAVICLALCMPIAACAEKQTEETTKAASEAVALTEEEQGILEAIGSDIHVVSDEDYIKTVAEMMYHTAEYAGQVYQLEGILSVKEDSIQLCRTLVSEDETMTLGLPMRYLEKEIADGSWVRVTAIVAQDDSGEEPVAVLDVVAIESLTEAGQAEMAWDGSEIHQH